MQKKLIVIVLVLLIGGFAVFPAAADSQVDITLYWPYRIGIESENEDVSEAIDYAFLVPDLKYNYFFVDDVVKVGVGARLFTLILESMAFPVLTVEAELDRFVLNANVGGEAFFFFGLWNSFETENIILPELSAAYKMNDWFSVGTGVTLFFAPGVGDFNNFAWIGHVFGRFTF